MTAEVSGLRFRVVPGRKADGDLRLEWSTAGGWVPVSMTAAALMTDFFVENEDYLRQFRPHWRMTATEKLFDFLGVAIGQGWTVAGGQLEDERRQAAAQVPVTTVTWCRAKHPDESVVCTSETGHSGPHRWNDIYVWPAA